MGLYRLFFNTTLAFFAHVMVGDGSFTCFLFFGQKSATLAKEIVFNGKVIFGAYANR